MKDPLAGRREDINDGRASALVWPDKGAGCPVEVGEVHVLRSCWIEITRKERRQGKKGQGWQWVAYFRRYTATKKLHLLSRSGGDYIESIDQEERAMRAQDDPDAATLYGDPMENPLNLRQPPEPEAVPPEEIARYTGSVEARQRYERDMAERRAEEASAPLERRLARLREISRCRNIDISSELRVIEQRIEKAERRVLARAAA